MKKIQYFDIETSINDKRNIKGFELDNKIKIVLISDPDINISSCSIAVGAGYLHDDYPGTAHFLEHLLFMGSEKYPEQNIYHSYIQINGGEDNAYTADILTCYYLALESTFLKKGIEMLSWFFRSPLLNESHILSEMEIIDAEHNKNILSDNWIMDDIFKNFILPGSKYKKFGTGNLKSLNKITKKDILDFYDKYYTTDNLYVCIVDSKNISQMIGEYLEYFQEIPMKIFDKNKYKSDRFHKDKLKLIKPNLIFFKSTSDYLITNYYLILDSVETNLIDYQLIHFINYLIGIEYQNSLSFYLKKNDIVKNISSNVDYFYDYSSNINIQLIMNDSSSIKIYKSYYLLLDFLRTIKNLSENKFIDLWENYKKIKTLRLLYGSNNDPISTSNLVVENMIRGNIDYCLVKNNKVPEYSKFIYDKYVKILSNIQIKMTTNINFNNIPDELFIKSKWYSSYFYIDNIKFHKNINKKSMDEFEKINFNVENIIGIKNFLIKNDFINFEINKNAIPKLIFQSDRLYRRVYLLEHNKYNKPIGSITVIRKNKILFDKYSKLLIEIYKNICYKTLNYFLDVFNCYKLYFNLDTSGQYLIYNFMGINYELNLFISQIINKIHPDVLFNSSTQSKKYFYETIRDMKEHILNSKYNSPFGICSKYIYYLLDNNLFPEEKINYISKLTWDDFISKIQNCLKYTHEYFLIVGLNKCKYLNSIDQQKKNNYKLDPYINHIIDLLELNPTNYLINEDSLNNILKNENIFLNIDVSKKKLFKNFNINMFDINPLEINNCLIRYWICSDPVEILYETENKYKIKKKIANILIKNKLIMDFVSNILNEPLFDKIRTIDKLGYIVKVNYKMINPIIDTVYFIVYFLIQSSYTIQRIDESIKNFSKLLFKDLKKNNKEYREKFRLLKESKIIDLKKPFADFEDETNSYIGAILGENFEFNISSLYLEICEEINFNDVQKVILNIINDKSNHFDIVLDKNNTLKK